MAHLLRLRAQAPHKSKTKRWKKRTHQGNGLEGRMGNTGESTHGEVRVRQLQKSTPYWDEAHEREELTEWPLEALEAELPFDDSFEEIGYGGFRRRCLPSADEQR